MMMKNQTKEQTSRGSYAPPVCVELPVWAEGPLCGSGFTETVSESDEEDW